MLKRTLDQTSLRVSPALLAAAVAIAVISFPTRSVARDGAAVFGALAGVAAAAIIANGIAQQQQPRVYRSARHRRHVAHRSRPAPSQASMADPFAGVAVSKTRPARD
ncbi:hypothetical protein Rpal_2706 [Rhodopseudomonas palustris TIE-1]|uniref:hypothetical protein n=1 Tax=Rhodopseudomonas palustris TaxID=1076 RepID=UPI000164A689|nr:hypothetical protein [Rhodopseudomonas palustris]ACF01215.1 hypothetical protein Rpal_2706 [Rhodopseudomonas palustris TIE-1]